MLNTVVLFGSLRVVEAVEGTDEVTGNPADAFKTNAFANAFNRYILLDKYKDKNGKDRIDNFEERVLKPAKAALDESCPYTFNYVKAVSYTHLDVYKRQT